MFFVNYTIKPASAEESVSFDPIGAMIQFAGLLAAAQGNVCEFDSRTNENTGEDKDRFLIFAGIDRWF